LRYYNLDDQGQPYEIDFQTYMDTAVEQVLAERQLGPIAVVTTWIGIDRGPGDFVGYQTTAFVRCPLGSVVLGREQYENKEAALDGHERTVMKLDVEDPDRLILDALFAAGLIGCSGGFGE